MCTLENRKERKTEKLSANASKLGMNGNIPKTKVLMVNAKVNSLILLGGEDIELVQQFCYLDGVINTDDGTDKDICVRIGKARYAFRALQPVWLSSQLSVNTKLRILVLGSSRLGMHLGPYICGLRDHLTGAARLLWTNN